MEPPFQTETLVQIESKSADKASGAMERKGGVDPPGLCELEVVPLMTACKELGAIRMFDISASNISANAPGPRLTGSPASFLGGTDSNEDCDSVAG